MANPWFRLYSKIMTDPVVEFLSFEDQRHFVWLLCLKNDGVLDEKYPKHEMLEKVVARKLGLQGEAWENFKERIFESGLIERDTFQPVAWGNLQYKSDSSTERSRKYRERLKKKRCNGDATSLQRHCNVTVTAQDTEADTDTEEDSDAGIGNWSLSEPVITQLKHLGVPDDFIKYSEAEFRSYWSEREPSKNYNSKFIRSTNREWQQQRHLWGKNKNRGEILA